MARPTKKTEEIVKRIEQYLNAGNTRKTACTVSGVSEDTFSRWMKRYADFAEAIKRAEEEAVARNVALINQAASKQWQAAAWWLERRRPEDWRERVDIGGGAIDLTVFVGYDPKRIGTRNLADERAAKALPAAGSAS